MADNAIPRDANAGADGFRQAMLKTALETIPQLTEENYSIWKDKMTALLKLRGVFGQMNNPAVALGESDNAELTMLLLAKMDSVTHNNVVTADNSESAQKIWQSIKERFASNQASNRARMFNDFLYVKFQEDSVESFVTDIKVSIKKLVDVGIELPQDILAYLVLFKFPNSLQTLKRQIMHSDKELSVEFVCNHLIQFNNESRAEIKETSGSNPEAALFSNRGRNDKNSGKDKPNAPKRCKSGYHNPKQDANHSADNCWHLHPEIAPDWWKESQAQWKAGKGKEKESYYLALLTRWIESGNPKDRIVLDTGASAHIFNDEKFFLNIKRGDFDVIKTGKQGATLPIRGRGTVQLNWNDTTITLDNCLLVPDIVINLVSAGELDSKGCTLASKNASFTVSKDDRLAFSGKIEKGLYTIKNPVSIGKENNYSVHLANQEESLKETHERFGHASLARLEKILGKSISNAEKRNFECKSCVMSKITKQPFKHQSKLADKPFERLHLDLIGPIQPESAHQHKFILTVVDNHSGYLAAFPLVHKDDTTDVLINLLTQEERRRGYFPRMICSDGGGEFIGNRAERANRTIVESMRASFRSSKIPKKYWHEVAKTCCLGLNQLPRGEETQSPWQILHGKSFPTEMLKPIGTPVITLNMTRTKGRKFDPKGEEGRKLQTRLSLKILFLNYERFPWKLLQETLHQLLNLPISGRKNLS
ncbi:hypothetical protein VP01_577g8 [Puccinia sorghi]|uniref:Integrase catalytic domain-containing protein n=1 Tax=Puccinia sorghi TaxID=27349 RepID=A0A0L6UJ21_9BASI|nr:hypothetical protein VP01_577g8 [Puccinia sorghi]